MNIGGTIRRLRKRQGRTLQEIADRCGFTCSLLSKIETGKTVPPISTLTKIADALGVRVPALLEDNGRQTTILGRAGEAASALVPTDKGYLFHCLAAQRPDKLMQPYLIVARRGEIVPQDLTHPGEEFIYILEGQVKSKVGQVEYVLGPGDSLYFDAEQPHDLTPLSEEVRMLSIFIEPPALKKRET